MKLLHIYIRNFKGIKQLDIPIEGNSIAVYGDNGTGKTSVGDAIRWLLLDKDMQDRQAQSFGIKPREKGKVVHNLDTEVKGTFEDVTLRKVYRENWVRERGSAEKVLKNHTTDYYYDDAPVSKTEFTNQVAEIMSEEMFKILTVPSYFPEQTHWTDRRKVLNQIAGKTEPEDIFKSDKELLDIKEDIEKSGLSGVEDKFKRNRKNILDDIDTIPARIDELHRQIQDIDVVDEVKVDVLEKKRNDLQSKLESHKRGGGVHELEEKMYEYRSEQSKLRSEFEEKAQEQLSALRKKRDEAQEGMDEFQNLLRQKTIEVRDLQSQINEVQSYNDDRELELKKLENSTPPAKQSGECPYCKRAMENHSEKEHEKAVKEWNKSRAEGIKKLKSEIKKTQESIDVLQDEIKKAEESREDLLVTVESAEKEVQIIEEKISEAKSKMNQPEDSEQWKAIEADMKALQERMDEISNSASEVTAKMEQEILSITEQIDLIKKNENTQENNARLRKRIKELTDELNDRHKELEIAERKLYLIEKYRLAEAEVVSDKVNKLFNNVQWVMYEEQINGGIKEVCEAVYDGIPYSEGLNNASRIKAGMEIIEVLSKHFGKQAPVIIDNAEAITQLPKTDLQVIALIVSEKHKSLTFESL